MTKMLTLVLSLFFLSPSAWAKKLTLDVGFYSLKADAGSNGGAANSVNVSSPGIFSLSASFNITPHLEISPGYTVFFSKGLGGDSGFGPDFSLNYFPFSSGTKLSEKSPSLSYSEVEIWRPFVGFSFHQRQFQSIQSSYSGFGFSGGTEYQMTEQHSLRLMVRTMNLVGPSSGKLNTLDVLLGLQLAFD